MNRVRALSAAAAFLALCAVEAAAEPVTLKFGPSASPLSVMNSRIWAQQGVQKTPDGERVLAAYRAERAKMGTER